MFTRTLALVACVMMLATAGCGGDEGSSGPPCTGTEMSVPGSPKDPCDQTDMMCKAAGGMAYATCENGKWPDMCKCIAPQPTLPVGGQSSQPATVQAICGDTIITAPSEKCDGSNLNGTDCRSLGFTGGGTLLCNPTTCTFDTIMCRMTVGTGGAGTSGGAGTGGGAGMGG
jgi:hypothetical protein